MTKKEFDRIVRYYTKENNFQENVKWILFFMAIRSYKLPLEWIREIEADLVEDDILPFMLEESDLIYSRIKNDGSTASAIQRQILGIMRQCLGQGYIEKLEEDYMNKI